MAETERKKPSKSRTVLVKMTKSKHAGHRDKRFRYRKTVSDDEESLMKNADLLDQQDSSETNALLGLLPFHRLETLGTEGELGSKESRNNYADKSENVSKSSKLEQSTDDGELFKVDEGVLRMAEIRLLENNRHCTEVIVKSLNDVVLNSDDENETVGVNSGQIGGCYLRENPSEEMAVGRIKTLQAESSNTAHDQRRGSELFQRVPRPTSAEIATKTNTFVDRSDPRQPEHGREVKTIKRISKKRWRKRTKKCKKIDAEKETVPISISGDKDSETIEILEMDEDDRKQTKIERRKKRRKRAKKMAKTAGVTVWKGIREGWKLMWSGLAMYTLPLGSLDVSTNVAKVWSTKTNQ